MKVNRNGLIVGLLLLAGALLFLMWQESLVESAPNAPSGFSENK